MNKSSQPEKSGGRKRNKNKDMSRRNTVMIGETEIELSERVVKMSRVAKVVKGGRRFSFNALTVVGDSDSYVGLGFGKAREVPEAIRKSIEGAKNSIIKVKKQGNTIPHEVLGKYKSARVLLKPCSPGTGIIAGEAVRAIVELGGIKDVLTKALGSSNSLNIVKATMDALDQLETQDEAKERRSITLPQLFGEYSAKRKKEKAAERETNRIANAAKTADVKTAEVKAVEVKAVEAKSVEEKAAIQEPEVAQEPTVEPKKDEGSENS